MAIIYNIVPTVATGDLWSAADHNTYVRDNFAVGAPGIISAKGDLIIGTDLDNAKRLAAGHDYARLEYFNNDFRWSFGGGPGFLARSKKAQSVEDNDITELTFEQLDYDVGSFYSKDSGVATIPIGLAGVYLVEAEGFYPAVSGYAKKICQLGVFFESADGLSGSNEWVTTIGNADNTTLWLCFTHTLYMDERAVARVVALQQFGVTTQINNLSFSMRLLR